MGSKSVEPPHLDALAHASLAFPRGHVVNSPCAPSLASLRTGLHPHLHGVTGNDPPMTPAAGQGAARYRSAVFGSNATQEIVGIGQPAKSLRYRSVVARDWKLIVSSGLHDALEPPRLFQLKDDPDE